MDRKKYTEDVLEKMVDDLAKLISIDSSWDPDTADEAAGTPFGKGPKEAIDAVIELAESMGMTAKDYDGYAAEITVGTGDKMIGILAHADVVEAGPGWDTPPFEATVKDGKIFGRGSLDDKGPVVSSLYAVKYIMDNGLLPEDHSIRIIVGADEEEGLRCIDYYNENAERLPDVSFVPDGYFPMVNCEKGLVDFDLEYDCEAAGGLYGNGIADSKPYEPEAVITYLRGGLGRNMVPAEAICEIESAPEKRAEVAENLRAAVSRLMSLERAKAEGDDKTTRPARHISMEETPSGFRLTASGVSAHAMSPEKGASAVDILISALKSSGLALSCGGFADAYMSTAGAGYDGSGVNSKISDEISGPLTLNIGTIEMKDNVIRMQGNTRYPASLDKKYVMDKMYAAFEKAGFSCTEQLYLPPLYAEKEAPLVSKLMEAYMEVTGDMENDMFSIGGATYARSIPNAISFGPLFPDEVELAHEANEFLSIESLRKMTEIYILALEKLIRE